MTNPYFFIIGMPRSGTKLIRELLNNHEEIFIPEIETLFIPDFLKRFGGRALNSREVYGIINELKESLFFFYYHNKYDFDFSSLETENVTIIDFIDLFFTQLAEQRKVNVSILGDKSPNYINEINLLQHFYPNAKFIHIVRDPRDYALSMKNAWGKNMYRAAYRWNEAMQVINNCKKNNLLEIRYENLIASPDTVLRKVCSFLNVEFCENLLSLNKAIENLGDARSAKIHNDNSNKFLKNFKKKQLFKIECLVSDFLVKYNYQIYSNNVNEVYVSRVKLNYWKILDTINLLKFNFKEYGFSKGFEKLYKASKYV